MDIKDLLNPEGSSDDQKKESPLKSLEADLKFYNESLKEVAIEIMVEGISAYPIFVAHQHVLNLGEVIWIRMTSTPTGVSTLQPWKSLRKKGSFFQTSRINFLNNTKMPINICAFL